MANGISFRPLQPFNKHTPDMGPGVVKILWSQRDFGFRGLLSYTLMNGLNYNHTAKKEHQENLMFAVGRSSTLETNLLCP